MRQGKGIEFNLPLLPLECHRQRGGFEVEGCRPTSTDRYSYRCPKPYPFCSRRRREKKWKKERRKNRCSSLISSPPLIFFFFFCVEKFSSRDRIEYETTHAWLVEHSKGCSIDLATGVQKYRVPPLVAWICETVRLERRKNTYTFPVAVFTVRCQVAPPFISTFGLG